MSNLKEITSLDSGSSDAQNSLGTLLTIGAENQAYDSSSTFSERASETLSVFDPNYDANSVLGRCLLLQLFFSSMH